MGFYYSRVSRGAGGRTGTRVVIYILARAARARAPGIDAWPASLIALRLLAASSLPGLRARHRLVCYTVHLLALLATARTEAAAPAGRRPAACGLLAPLMMLPRLLLMLVALSPAWAVALFDRGAWWARLPLKHSLDAPSSGGDLGGTLDAIAASNMTLVGFDAEVCGTASTKGDTGTGGVGIHDHWSPS